MTIPTSRVLLCVGLVAAFLLAGCGGASHHSAPKPPAPTSASVAPPATSAQALPGLLAIYPSAAQPLAAFFIQWQRTRNTVTGTLSVSYRDPPSGSKGTSTSFTGTISGQSVGLDFGGSINQRENGTLRGDRLTLAYAASDGSLETLVFAPATAADYNTAVANVKAGGIAQGRQQARAQADANARQAIDADVSTVATDIQNLSGHLTSAQTDLGSFSTDLAQESKDVSTTKADLAKTLTLSSPDLCNQAYTTQDDAYSVQDDVYSLTDDGYKLHTTYGGDLDLAANDIASIQSDFAKLTSDRALLPSYQPQSAPTEVSSTITSAQTTIAQVNAKMRGYFAQGQAMLKTANGYAAQAQAACTKAGG